MGMMQRPRGSISRGTWWTAAGKARGFGVEGLTAQGFKASWIWALGLRALRLYKIWVLGVWGFGASFVQNFSDFGV